MEANFVTKLRYNGGIKLIARIQYFKIMDNGGGIGDGTAMMELKKL